MRSCCLRSYTACCGWSVGNCVLLLLWRQCCMTCVRYKRHVAVTLYRVSSYGTPALISHLWPALLPPDSLVTRRIVHSEGRRSFWRAISVNVNWCRSFVVSSDILSSDVMHTPAASVCVCRGVSDTQLRFICTLWQEFFAEGLLVATRYVL